VLYCAETPYLAAAPGEASGELGSAKGVISQFGINRVETYFMRR
jgi:hypothetical protein